jgi:hypothetical protein
MLNMVNIYHIRDSYDHSKGYGHNNIYTNVSDDVIKELLSKQERYLKSNDIGGYWIQVTSYEVGQTPTVVDHIKVVPQKTRIELNVKAKREGKRKNLMTDFAAMGIQAGIPAAVWNVNVDAPIEVVEMPQDEAPQEEWL